MRALECRYCIRMCARCTVVLSVPRFDEKRKIKMAAGTPISQGGPMLT
jgi:hypothetical protein